MMRSMTAGSLVALLAALAMLSLDAGVSRAQQNGDEGRMRASSEEDWSRRPLIPGERIARTADGGTFIVLRDSTVWEVFLADRTSTVGWREGDFLIVKKAPLGQNVGQRNYVFELINGRTDERAVVIFRGKSG
ncbi:MAG TPA: hypothetical protein VFR95_04530 [Gemmatimonadaceae bacterium]|nr:hypothetical protein [Gemmatimonadaceae bacterium]